MSFRERLLLLITLAVPAIALVVFVIESDTVRQAVRVTLRDEHGPMRGVDIKLSRYAMPPSCKDPAEGFRSWRGVGTTGSDGSLEWQRSTTRLDTDMQSQAASNDFVICMRVKSRWQPIGEASFGALEVSRINASCDSNSGKPPRCELLIEPFDRKRSNFKAFMYLLVFPQTAWGYRLRNLAPRQRTGAISETWIIVFEVIWTLAFFGYEWFSGATIGLAVFLCLWVILVHRAISQRR